MTYWLDDLRTKFPNVMFVALDNGSFPWILMPINTDPLNTWRPYGILPPVVIRNEMVCVINEELWCSYMEVMGPDFQVWLDYWRNRVAAYLLLTVENPQDSYEFLSVASHAGAFKISLNTMDTEQVEHMLAFYRMEEQRG